MINELKQARLDKLNKIREASVDPYPAKCGKTHAIKQTLDNFDNFSKSEKEIVLAGRIMAIRGHGGSTFVNIEDGSGKMQVYFKKDELKEKKYQFLENFDLGDFIQAKGSLFITKKGEKTLLVQNYKILTKSLSPLPEKRHGLKDEEERLRKRYLDILFDSELKKVFIKKSIFWNSVREFMVAKGFLEVETPVLENTPGGADAKPFITHHNALDIDVYLRISAGELWQKRLMVAGFEKTFEIGRIFRNEGMDAEHLQDYTQIEFYWAYADYKMAMELVKEMYCYAAEKTFGTLEFQIKDFKINLGKEWKRYDYREEIKKFTEVDILKTDLDEIRKKLSELKIKYEKNLNLARGIDNLWKYCRRKIAGPGFLVNIPVIVSPLAKKLEDNPELAQRFQPIIAGSEMGNGYSELNDPIDQTERFKEQMKLRQAGDEEAQMMEKDCINALAYGMPPTAGFGVSERLFSFLMNKPIRECQTFPLMRPKSF
jgi:lysyl-tRNA synthetase class 2